MTFCPYCQQKMPESIRPWDMPDYYYYEIITPDSWTELVDSTTLDFDYQIWAC